jgi:chorismate synthase
MNSFGTLFRVNIFGESHGPSVGITIDGCPAGIDLKADDFADDIERRKGGLQKGTTPRKEDDLPIFLSGLFNDKTTGAPLTIIFENNNTRSADYEKQRAVPRPGHADFTAGIKFGGFEDFRGGGHFSGRLTVCLVAAGVVAKKILAIKQIICAASIKEIGGETDPEKGIEKAIAAGDSVGGIVECKMFGSEHNDTFTDAAGKTKTNHAGGISGGITNGNELVLRIAVKPTSSTPKEQETFNKQTGQVESFSVKGRHDLCIALRVPVVLEAVTALVIADLLLLEQKISRLNS